MKSHPILRKAQYLPLGILGLYPIILALLTIPWVQKQFIFLHWVQWPLFANYDNPERYGLAPYKTRNFHLNTTDGETLGVWHILPTSVYHSQDPFPPRSPISTQKFETSLSERPTVLYFHGNAANRAAPHRVRGYSAFSNNLDCNVLAVDYRAFGDSSGTPSEEGLINDARAVWDYVVRHASEKNGEGHGEEEEKDIILVGQSLGTGVVAGFAGQLAGEGIYPRALVLIAPFTSITELLESFWLFGFVPLLSPLKSFPWALSYFQSFMAYPFNSTAALSGTKSPILILHAKDDDVIPHPHSARLFHSLREDPSAEIQTQEYPNWGVVSTFARRHQGKGGEVIWWDGLRGGHNDIGWAEGSIDLIKRIGGL